MFPWQPWRCHIRCGFTSQCLYVLVPKVQLHRALPSRPSHPASGLCPVCRSICRGNRSKVCGGSGRLLRHSLLQPWWAHASLPHSEQVCFILLYSLDDETCPLNDKTNALFLRLNHFFEVLHGFQLQSTNWYHSEEWMTQRCKCKKRKWVDFVFTVVYFTLCDLSRLIFSQKVNSN